MTSEREAKVWMVAAGVLVVWACTMVGCTNSYVSGPATPLNRPATTALEPVWSDTPTITLTPDTSATAWRGTAEPGLEPADPTRLFAPSQPDVIVVQPQPASPSLDLDLSGLSIAQPLVSAKRLLVAAVSVLPPVTTPERAQAFSAVPHADESELPVAAVTGWSFELPEDGAAVVLGPAMLSQGDLLLPPWKHDPLPTPTVATAMTADEAKFDASGIVALVIGAMVLLFGGEAVVLWLLHRRRRNAGKAETPVADHEESIFRFPEPVEAEDEASYSRAA